MYKPNKREEELEKVIKSIFWMARRYAHGRHTYAPSIVRDVYHILKANGVKIDDGDETIKPPETHDAQSMNFRSDYLDDIN